MDNVHIPQHQIMKTPTNWVGSGGLQLMEGYIAFHPQVLIGEMLRLWDQFVQSQGSYAHHRVDQGVFVELPGTTDALGVKIKMWVDPMTRVGERILNAHQRGCDVILQPCVVTGPQPLNPWIMGLIVGTMAMGGSTPNLEHCPHCGQPGDHTGMEYSAWNNRCGWL